MNDFYKIHLSEEQINFCDSKIRYVENQKDFYEPEEEEFLYED